MHRNLDDVYESDIPKYNRMSKILSKVYTDYTHVDNDEMKIHKKGVQQIIDVIIQKMRAADDCFDSLYHEVIINGSVGDDLKVDKADEFDWDIVLVLPRCVRQCLKFSNVPGYVHVECRLPRNLPRAYRKLRDLVDDSDKEYLQTSKVREWVENLVRQVLKDCSYRKAYCIKGYKVQIKKIRPGFTMEITGPKLVYPVSVDVVTTFEFDSRCWPQGRFRRPTNNKDPFYIVPKETTRNINHPERYWRLSAQEQELDVLHHKYNLRPCLMLLKKLRDYMQLNELASYYIKTVCMNELEDSDEEFWTDSMGYCFMHLLKSLTVCFTNKKLPYYWNENDNLIGHLENNKCSQLARQLKRVYDSIVRSRDPEKVLEYLLSDEDYNAFQDD